MQLHDKVRIRGSHTHLVQGYQSKALFYRRLIGVVVAVNGQAAKVDFTQHEMPVRPDGLKPGQNVKVNRHSRLHRPDGMFHFSMLEKVR